MYYIQATRQVSHRSVSNKNKSIRYNVPLMLCEHFYLPRCICVSWLYMSLSRNWSHHFNQTRKKKENDRTAQRRINYACPSNHTSPPPANVIHLPHPVSECNYQTVCGKLTSKAVRTPLGIAAVETILCWRAVPSTPHTLPLPPPVHPPPPPPPSPSSTTNPTWGTNSSERTCSAAWGWGTCESQCR